MMQAREQAALERLLRIAGANTGQSRSAASFLLAWWNAEECGGFDLTDLWRVDKTIADDMVTIFSFVARTQTYPDSLGHSVAFSSIIRDKRPQLGT